MANKNNRISELFHKYLSNNVTDAERQEFLDYIDDPLYSTQVHELLSTFFDNQEELTDLNDAGRTRVLSRILQDEPLPEINQNMRRLLWPRIAAAAAIFLFMLAGFFYYHNSTTKKQSAVLTDNVIKPGGNKAYLILANGSKIELTNAKDGLIAKQSGITITKKSNGQVVYAIENTYHNHINQPEYNTIETPKGGQYEIKLPDGTVVLLNAASSLKYPVSFTSHKERNVELRGQAYFEVAKDKSHPFIVTTDKQTVKVLGTHFDINAYRDEPGVKTTLFEGSVKVTNLISNDNGPVESMLRPGEQSLLMNGSLTVSNADIESAGAWHQGMFMFKDADIKTIMRQIARWYNIDIKYKGEIPKDLFTGGISRQSDLNTLLNIFQISNIRFSVTQQEGRRTLTINP